jgi:hypothetical protein
LRAGLGSAIWPTKKRTTFNPKSIFECTGKKNHLGATERSKRSFVKARCATDKRIQKEERVLPEAHVWE